MKHFIKCLTIYLVTIGMVHANLPPTTLKGQAETAKPTTFNFEVPYNQATTTGSGTRLIETGNDNVIKDSGFEGNSLQWVTYADASGNVPVDGTGGTANITVAYTSTNPLNGKKSMLFTKDAANRQGQGTSLNFTIPDINKGKVNNIKISYDIASGTYATGDLTMWVINVDPASASNGRVIQPSAYTIENSGLKESKFLEFQSDIDSNLYRLVVHVTSTSASAYSLRFDDVSVGLGPKIYGSVTTDWIDFTPTGNWTTNTTYTGKWRRVGDVAEIDYRIALSGAPTAIGLNVSLPTGLVADFTKYPSSIGGALAGSGNATDTGVMTYPVNVYLVGTATLGVVAIGASGTYTNEPVNVNTTAPFTFGNGDVISFSVSVKIAGWSSSQQLSSDADTRVVSFNAASVSPVVITNANAGVTKLVFTSVYDDSHGSYNASTGEYTVKVPGVYQVYAKTFITMASGMQNLAVYKNSGREAYGTTAYGAATVESDVSWQGKVVAGDVISIRTFQTSGSGTATVGNASSTGDIFFIAKLSGPSQIASSETVSLRYTQTNAQSIPNATNTIVTYNNKIWDSHNAFNGATGIFTAPISGEYEVRANLLFSNVAWSVGQLTFQRIRKNSVVYCSSNDFAVHASITTYHSPFMVNCRVKLLQGDTLYNEVYHNRGSATSLLTNGDTYNYIEINRIGNY